MVHLHGSRLRRDPRAGHGRAEGGQPALPDHGRGGPDPLVPGLRLRARARLAAHDVRLDRSPRNAIGAWRCPSGSAPPATPTRSSAGGRSWANAPAPASSSSRAARRTGPGWTGSSCRAGSAGRRPAASATWAIPGWMPASCPSARCTSARIPTTGRSGSRPTSSRSPSRASSATGSTPCWPWAPCCATSRPSRPSSATPRCTARTAGPCTSRGATPSSSTRRPSAWAWTSCAGCTPVHGRRTTSSSGTTPPTRPAASCWCSGTCWPSSPPTHGWRAGGRVARSSGRRRPTRPGDCSTAGSSHGRRAWPSRRVPRWPSTTRAPRRGRSASSWTTFPRGGCGAAGAASRAPGTPRTRRPPSGRSTWHS